MQSDNSVNIIGRVIRGPLVNFVNVKRADGQEPKTKIRVKYLVRIQTRIKDSNQIFTVWVRTMGNQAMKDRENIKTGDLIAVSGRIASRKEYKTKFLYLDTDADGNSVLKEVDINDELKLDQIGMDNIFTFKDVSLVNEIQGNDVTYLTQMVAQMGNNELERLFDDQRMKTLGEHLALSRASAIKKMRVIDADEEDGFEEIEEK